MIGTELLGVGEYTDQDQLSSHSLLRTLRSRFPRLLLSSASSGRLPCVPSLHRLIMSELSSSLLKMPVDFWTTLSPFLDLITVTHLYFCGCRRLNTLLSRTGITSAVIRWPSQVSRLTWPKPVALFENLRYFVFDAGKVSGMACYYPSMSDLKMLSPNLRTLVLRSDGAEQSFWAQDSFATTENQYWDKFDVPLASEPLDIGKTFPQLERIELAQFGWALRLLGTEVLRTLPSTLTHFDLTFASQFECEDFALFPEGLTYLRLAEFNIDPKYFKLLPRHITSLSLAKLANCTLISSTIEEFGDLPRDLKTLEIGGWQKGSTSELLQYLPTTIEKLTFHHSSIIEDWMKPIAYRFKHLKELTFDTSTKINPAASVFSHLQHLERLVLKSEIVKVHIWDQEQKRFVPTRNHVT